METQARQRKQVKMGSLLVPGVLALVVLLAPAVLGQYYGYVTNAGVMGSHVKGSVSIIDLATNTVVATVPVGECPQGVAVNPAGTAVYVANTDSNNVTVIDAITHKTTSIPVGAGPVGITVHPDGTRIYVANTDDAKNTVSVIDRATNTVIDKFFCGTGSIAFAAHPDGSVLFVANAFDGSVAVLDTQTHKVIHTIKLGPVAEDKGWGSYPVPIVVHPDGTYVYVANRLGSTLWAINTATYEYVARPFGHNHCGMALNPAGTVLYLPDFDAWPMPPTGTKVDVIDARTLDRITTIEGLTGPMDVSVHPEGTRFYVTNGGGNTVSVIDAATYAVSATIPVGSHPAGFGEFIGPGVPRLLKEDAVTRLQAVKDAIAGGADGVNSRPKALECLETALTSGKAFLAPAPALWSVGSDGKVDPRRLHRTQGKIVFDSEQAMVEAILDAIRRGWIVNAKLHAELLAIVDEVVRADRVLAAVAIDDAIVAKANAAGLNKAQGLLEQADALAKEAAIWSQLDKKTLLFREAIGQYEKAWEAARNLVP